MSKSTALTLLVRKEDIAALDQVVKECSLQHLSVSEQFEATFRMAAGVRRLKELISADAMKDIMQLQNTPLGFLTDQSDRGYPVEVVKDCVIEATLRGLRVVGNEFNIISRRCYITKAGFARLVREFQGVSNLKLTPDIPKLVAGGKGATVRFRAEWLRDGKPDRLEREFAVRVNAGMGSDAIIGKATRKILCAIYERLTGSEYSLPEGEVGDEIIDTSYSRVEASTVGSDLPDDDNPAAGDEPPDGALFDTSELATEANHP